MRFSIRFLLIATLGVAVTIAVVVTLSRPPRIAVTIASIIETISPGTKRTLIQEMFAERFKTEQFSFQLQVSESEPALISDRFNLPRGYAVVFFYEDIGSFPDDLSLLSAMVIGPNGQPVMSNSSVEE